MFGGKYVPIAVKTFLNSADEMKPRPSLSKVFIASIKSANVPVSLSSLTTLKIGRISSNLNCFSPKTRKA